MKLLTFLTFTFSLLISNLTAETVLYNTSDAYDPDGIRPGFEMWADDEVITQPFNTGNSDSIVSVELDARILSGSPTGRISIEVWDDDGNGKPGEKQGTLGSILVDDLPAATKRPVVHTIVEGLVSDLKPQSHYHVILNHSEVVFRPPLERDKVWYTTFGSDPLSSGAGKAAARGDFTGNQWKTLESILDGDAKRRFLVMKIVGSASPPTHTLTIIPDDHGTVTADPDMETYPAGAAVSLTATPNDGYEFFQWQIGNDEISENPLTFTIEADTTVTPIFTSTIATFIIATTEDGMVAVDPDLDTYPIGSEVTVRATPEPGFEFVKWLYGDQEFTTNPATITVASDATLTPIFEAAQPKPIVIDVLPAMAIRWESEEGETYVVQSSPDLENWVVEAEDVEGTGETMTHFFLRTSREMYYRVLHAE